MRHREDQTRGGQRASRRRRRVFPSVIVAGAVAASLSACVTPPSPEPTNSTSGSSTSLPPALAPLRGQTAVAAALVHSKTSAPRFGLTEADIVYVEPLPKGGTQLLPIYTNRVPPRAGPVADATEVDADIIQPYGSSYFFSRGATKAVHELIRRAGSTEVSADGVSTRDFHKMAGRKAPDNQAAGVANYIANQFDLNEPEDPGFRFGPAAPGGSYATELEVPFKGQKVKFTFDEDTQRYAIANDGKPEIAAETKKAITATTVVVQSVEMVQGVTKDDQTEDSMRPKVVGDGDVLVLREGRAWAGKWSRASVDKPTEYTIKDETITMIPGQVWVLLLPKSQSPSLGGGGGAGGGSKPF